MAPREVWRKLYGTFIIVTIGRSNTHCLNLLDTSHLLNDGLQCLNTSIDIVLYFLEALGLNSSCCLNLASTIHDTENRIRTSKIQTYNIGFNSCLCVHVI